MQRKQETHQIVVERVALEEAAIRAAAQVRAPGLPALGRAGPPLPGAGAGPLLTSCFLAMMIGHSACDTGCHL